MENVTVFLLLNHPPCPPCSRLTEPGQILLTFPPTYPQSIKCHANINLKNKRQYNLSQRVLDACKSDPLLRFKNSLSLQQLLYDWAGVGSNVKKNFNNFQPEKC